MRGLWLLDSVMRLPELGAVKLPLASRASARYPRPFEIWRAGVQVHCPFQHQYSSTEVHQTSNTVRIPNGSEQLAVFGGNPLAQRTGGAPSQTSPCSLIKIMCLTRIP